MAIVKNETIKELSERPHISAKIKYQEMIKTGLCACKYCKPMKFRAKGIWILREINHEYQTDTIYAVCREYYSEKLKSMFIMEYHEQKMNPTTPKKIILLNVLVDFLVVTIFILQVC